MVGNAATILRRRQLIAAGKSVQDYVVLPDQPWLDGIATSPGQVRQFLAMPVGQGYTVEAQKTGAELVAGLQFEITPLVPGMIEVTIREEHCVPYTAKFWERQHVVDIHKELGMADDDYLRLDSQPVLINETLAEADIADGATLQVVRSATLSEGFAARQRDFSIHYCDNKEPGLDKYLLVSVDDTINDLKHLLEPNSKRGAQKVKVFAGNVFGQRDALPLDGRLTLGTVFHKWTWTIKFFVDLPVKPRRIQHLCQDHIEHDRDA